MVFEVGFAEDYEDLRSDVRQWLEKAGKKVRLVVLVDIQEDRGWKKERSIERQQEILNLVR